MNIDLMNSTNICFIDGSKKGLKRSRNQDANQILRNKNYDLFLIFDGVSSNHNSHILVKAFKKKLVRRWDRWQNGEFAELFYLTHEEILSEKTPGAATLSALLMAHSSRKAYYLNIGDSRIYGFTNRYIRKLTKDDSLKNRNIITKYLGMSEFDISDFQFNSIDYEQNFLLCTDGFYTLMEKNLKDYFLAFNFKRIGNIKRKLSVLQRRKNNDDSSYIIVKHEV